MHTIMVSYRQWSQRLVRLQNFEEPRAALIRDIVTTQI